MKRHIALSLFIAFSIFAAEAEDWMARLDDNTFVTQLCIPGSHDAATGNGFADDVAEMGEAFARTQALPLSGQWACGVRAFDLRPASSGGSLLIRHGILDTRLRFADALALLRDSLIAHPTEFAIVIVRHEDDGEDQAEKSAWTTLMQEVVTADDIAPYIAPFSRSATVGDLRGRILLLSRNTYKGSRGGIISGWSHSATTSEQRKASITPERGTLKATLYCQDFYDVSADAAPATKLATVRAMLDFSTTQAAARTNSYVWVINHTSGYTLTTWGISTSDGYCDNAATQNAAVIGYLDDEAHWGPTGIVLMDYAGVDAFGDFATMGLTLTRTLIENNFRYTPKGRSTAGITPQTLAPSGGEASAAGAIYTLDGRLATRPHRGIYVRNGRKRLN